jgi:hypothetical protein
MTKTMQLPTLDDKALDAIANTVKAICGLGVALAAAAKWLLPWASQRMGVRDVQVQLSNMHDLNNEIAESRKCGSERTIVFAAHNGSGIPRPGSPFYASAIHWDVDEDWQKHTGKTESIRDYKMIEVDAAYIEMLLGIINHGSYLFVTEKERECFLKAVYDRAGIVESYLAFLGVHNKKLYYASFARYDHSFRPAEITALSLKANAMKRILTKAHK